MDFSFSSNLPYGKLFLCYNPAREAPSAAVVDCVKEAVSNYLPCFEVLLLPTAADTDGLLMARRFNLGVVSGGYGVLAVPRCAAESPGMCARGLALGLLDVDSFRNEPLLFLNKVPSDASMVRLDGCDSMPAEPNEAKIGVRKRSFWERLKEGASRTVRRCSSEEKGMSAKNCESSGQFAAEDSEASFEYEFLADECASGLSDVCPDEDSLEGEGRTLPGAIETSDGGNDRTDALLKEKEELAKQIASLVRLYILKYGTVDNDKIAGLLQGKMVLRDDKLSSLVVNKDCRVVLPDYNEMELDLGGPLHTSLYILFLRHPEGIVIKNISDYIAELEDIYTMVAPNFNTAPVHKLEETDRVTQSISKINRVVKSVLPVGNVAEQYSIRGARSKPYAIPLAAIDGKVLVMPKF